jgi:hypothetical protein
MPPAGSDLLRASAVLSPWPPSSERGSPTRLRRGRAPVRVGNPRSEIGVCTLLFGLAVLLNSCTPVPDPPLQFAEVVPGVSYVNQRDPDGPWSIHILRIERGRPDLDFLSVHAHGTALGLAPLTGQIRALDPALGTPLAAINGDFFQMADWVYAGDARGLQLVDGELLSAPDESVAFWVDANGNPRIQTVSSLFRVTWPDGTTNGFGLNEPLGRRRLVLFTPSLGWTSTGTRSPEMILERAGDGPWLPLRPGEVFTARVCGLNPYGNSPIRPGQMVLAVEWGQSWLVPGVQKGDLLRFSLATAPDLTGQRMALSGGPVLVRGGRLCSPSRPLTFDELPKPTKTMWERHPRTALGWNAWNYYLVVVDGRLKSLSVGMTLQEMAAYMVKLGCDEAMNLDGGGSSTMWLNGRIVNHTSDRPQRDIANALIVVRKPTNTPPASGSAGLH